MLCNPPRNTVEKNTDKKHICQVSGKIYNISRIRNSASEVDWLLANTLAQLTIKLQLLPYVLVFVVQVDMLKKKVTKVVK